MIRPVVGCYAVVEGTEIGWENAEVQLEAVCGCLRRAGMEPLKAPEIVRDEVSSRRTAVFFAEHAVDVLHPLIVTWSFDHYTHRIWQGCPAPVTIRTLPGAETGSTVGGQQLGALLYELEIPHRLYFAEPKDESVCAQIYRFAAAAALKRRLIGKKVAMIGRRTPGMTPVMFDEIEVLKRFGLVVETLGVDELKHAYVSKVSDAQAGGLWKGICAGAASVECGEADGIYAMKLYSALREYASVSGVSALALGSYPECQGTACLPLALLNEEGLPVGCEGDMNSTIAMLLLSELSGKPALFGEMLDIDMKNDEILTSHCGAGAPCYADGRGFALQPVRLAETGVSIRYCAMCGDITYACLAGRRGTYRLCAFGGVPVPTEMAYNGNPLRFKPRTPVHRIWDITAEHGFHHHWIAGQGDWSEVLKDYAELAGLKGVFPDLAE